jgi:hypothetical protein
VRFEQFSELTHDGERLGRLRQRREGAVSAFEQRIDAVVIRRQALDGRSEPGLGRRETREDVRVFHAVMTVKRISVPLPLALQRCEPRAVARCDRRQAAREAPQITSKGVVGHHQQGRHGGGAVVVQQVRSRHWPVIMHRVERS